MKMVVTKTKPPRVSTRRAADRFGHRTPHTPNHRRAKLAAGSSLDDSGDGLSGEESEDVHSSRSRHRCKRVHDFSPMRFNSRRARRNIASSMQQKLQKQQQSK